MYLLPIYLCFSSFLISFFFGYKLGYIGSILVNVSSIFISLLVLIFIFYEVCILHVNCSVTLMPWLGVGNVYISWSFLFDSLSCVMLIVILFISFCANVYSIEYMLFDPHKIRFFSYLSLFTFTMLMLVTANNIVQLFLGWECVGMSSYLLINFWYTRIQANKSSILAVMANKIGDILLLFACLLFFFLFNSVSFDNVFLSHNYSLYYTTNLYNSLTNSSIDSYVLPSEINIGCFVYENYFLNRNTYLSYNVVFFTSCFICFFIIVASICKSAQSGFHFWLAEAMEGPTPVSSLLHAATMVTAGIFLTVRCSFIFNHASDTVIFIIFIGSSTSFFSSIIGLTQNDLKKIVAYSTCSQLGFMFLSNGIFSYNYTMFHLFNHAFFKALLFLTSGYIIHILSNEQDLRKMGGLLKIIPLPYICLFIGSVALMGVPYLSGFFSKDTIVESFYSIFISDNKSFVYYSIVLFAQILIATSCIFTILYSIKLIYYVFFHNFNGYRSYILKIHFSSFCMLLPIMILSFWSITSGYLFSDMMIGASTSFWKNALNNFSYNQLIPNFFSFSNNSHFILIPYHFNKFTYYSLLINTVYFITVGFMIYYYYTFFLYFFGLSTTKVYNTLYNHLTTKMLFFNRNLVNMFISVLFMESYKATYKLLDKNTFEVVGPFGLTSSIRYISNQINKLSTGLLYHYNGLLFISVFVIFFFIPFYFFFF